MNKYKETLYDFEEFKSIVDTKKPIHYETTVLTLDKMGYHIELSLTIYGIPEYTRYPEIAIVQFERCTRIAVFKEEEKKKKIEEQEKKWKEQYTDVLKATPGRLEVCQM